MKKLIHRMRNNSFFKSVTTLMSGSIVAQLITIAASVFLARIYSPEELGVYTLILTAESLFGSVICLRYDVSIVSEKDEVSVFSLIKLSFFLTLILSVIVSCFYGKIYFWDDESYKPYTYAIVFICIMLISRGLLNILEAFNNRNREYALMTSTYVLRTAVQNIGSVILGLLKLGVLGIVFSHTVGSLCGMKRQAYKIVERKEEVKQIKKKDMIEIAKKNYKQPLFSSPAIFANRYSYSSISLFIGQLFGTNALGFYSISYKALGLPLTVLSNNVSKVFFKEAAKEYQSTGNFRKTFTQISLALIAISIPFGMIVYYFTPSIFHFVLGVKWSASARYVQILIPMFCVRLVVNTVAYGLQIVSKQNLELFFQLLLVFASAVTFFYARETGISIEGYLKIINISFLIIYIVYYISVFRYAFGMKK